MNVEWYGTRYQEVLSLIEDGESARKALLEQIEKLQSRIEESASDLEELRRHASWLARKAGVDQSLANVGVAEVVLPVPCVPTPTPGPTESKESPGIRHHADAIEEVLRDAGHPLRVAGIAVELLRRGHPLPENPTIRFNTIYSSMKRRPRDFVRLGMGRWGLCARDSSPIVWESHHSNIDVERQEPESEDFGDLNLIPS